MKLVFLLPLLLAWGSNGQSTSTNPSLSNGANLKPNATKSTWTLSKEPTSTPILASHVPKISSYNVWPYTHHNSTDPVQNSTNTKGVFAHYMVRNSMTWTRSQWVAEMLIAKRAKVDAFAMNVAYNEGVETTVRRAFAAADIVGFKLFFSFDYAGAGPWSKETVLAWLLAYKDRHAYYKYKGAPFASTFEGPDSAADWIDIKSETGCFFMPDWSSRGARGALELANGVADGLFSWAAWPWGNTNMDTYVDASYRDFLGRVGAKPYMMPISPWFYTNMPGFNKNWLWRGDDLWRDRWEQVMYVQPEFVQIISWNDYGESHYVGPLHDDGYEAFDKSRGNAPYNYVLDMPHTGWLTHIPYWIDLYKNGISSISQESLVAWYRLYPGASMACSTGNTTGNTANQLQIEFQPYQVFQDKVFFSMALTTEATVSVTIGGVEVAANWTDRPFDGVGIWHGSAAYANLTGAVQVVVSREGFIIAHIFGREISTDCPNGLANWNAWVGTDPGRFVRPAKPSLSIEQQVCVEGTGPGNYTGVCGFNCRYGYCPLSACQCLAMGKQRTLPPSTGVKGYPAAGHGGSFIGLCDFACGLGYCPAGVCSETQSPLVEPSTSPFQPPFCTGGTGPGQLADLCSYACAYGFCPILSCTCESTGNLVVPPPNDGSQAFLKDGSDDHGLCSFTCSRGVCPDACQRR